MKAMLKKLLPKRLINASIKVRGMVGAFIVRVAQKNKLLSSVYYLFSREFAGEQHAVLCGRVAYYQSLKDIGVSCALLRRNTHRLEKGLIMRPRRSVFAEKFIQETVDCYKDAIRSNKLDADEKKWATDVLDEYFKIVGSTKITDHAKAVYKVTRELFLEKNSATLNLPTNRIQFKPYTYEQLPTNTISFEQLMHLYKRRRSVRWYQNKPVPIDLVQEAANIASLAPSACNRQPYSFYFCNNKAKAVSIANCASGTVGFAENIPSIITIVGDLSAYPYERDRHLIYIDGSLAAMQFMLALETLGISTCPINWPDSDSNEKKIRKLVPLCDYERIIMLLAVGYADLSGGIPFSQKKVDKLILKDVV